jgi:hypothetical protein
MEPFFRWNYDMPHSSFDRERLLQLLKIAFCLPARLKCSSSIHGTARLLRLSVVITGQQDVLPS